MTLRPTALNLHRRTFVAGQAANLRRTQELEGDSRLDAPDRKRRLAPIEKEMRGRFDAFVETGRGLLAAELQDHALALPHEQIARAAYDNPAGAAAYLAIFSAATGPEKAAFARLAVAEHDLPAAYALLRALASDTVTPDAEKIAIAGELSQLTAPALRAADASLAACQHELALLEIVGWSGDENAIPDSTAMIAAANRVGALPREDGQVEVVAGAALTALLAEAGVTVGEV
jgi:hypothetical protein